MTINNEEYERTKSEFDRLVKRLDGKRATLGIVPDLLALVADRVLLDDHKVEQSMMEDEEEFEENFEDEEEDF